MKISKLHIEKFRHLENLEFDFTYPEDFHDEAKRGKPLDKICFIGQSATGKTGLLELIKEQHIATNYTIVNEENYSFKKEVQPIKGSLLFILNDEPFEIKNNEITFKNFKYKYAGTGGFSNLLKDEEKKSVYYFKANLISDNNIYFLSTNPVELIEKYNSKIENIEISRRNNKIKEKFFIFSENVDESVWLLLLIDFLDYRKKFTQKMSELIHKGLIQDPNKLRIEFDVWQKSNPNKLVQLAEKLNIILKKLNLEVDIINTEYSVPIKNKNNEEIIPFENTSTGTKQLLLTSLPLYSMETKDSIILIDEPERSLYPDMQMDLMEYYQNLAPEAQFIVATHSPFIAASFEPEERFILYFDETGKVAVRRGSSPIGDDPNDMLKNDFGVNYYNKFGEEAYKKYLNLKENLAKEKDPIKKKELLLETVKLGDTYNF